MSPMYHNSISEQVGLGLRAIHVASAFGHVEIVKVERGREERRGEERRGEERGEGRGERGEGRGRCGNERGREGGILVPLLILFCFPPILPLV